MKYYKIYKWKKYYKWYIINKIILVKDKIKEDDIIIKLKIMMNE